MTREEEALHRLELKISYLLRYGVILAGMLMAAGWVGSLITHGERLGAFRVYAPLTLRDSVAAAAASHDIGTLCALGGLAILVLLPVMRVLLTGVLFLKQRDPKLATLAFFVLAVLVASFALGIEI